MSAKTKTKPAKRYPPLPKQIDAPSGVIQVEFRDDLDGKDAKPDDPDTMGQYDPLNRIISLRRKMPRRQQWYTLYHEMGHLWLHESGLTNGLNDAIEEAIADAYATGLMRYTFG
jgi:Zn-dependent peptidase ImmA (M78 family)